MANHESLTWLIQLAIHFEANYKTTLEVKMRFLKYSNKESSQSRLCSAHLEVSLSPGTEGVPTNNQMDEDQGLLSSKEALTSPVI